MLGYLSVDIICSKKRKAFRERSSVKTASFEEKITFKEKYLSLFSPQMEAIVFVILQIFFAKGVRGFDDGEKISLGYFPL